MASRLILSRGDRGTWVVGCECDVMKRSKCRTPHPLGYQCPRVIPCHSSPVESRWWVFFSCFLFWRTRARSILTSHFDDHGTSGTTAPNLGYTMRITWATWKKKKDAWLLWASVKWWSLCRSLRVLGITKTLIRMQNLAYSFTINKRYPLLHY